MSDARHGSDSDVLVDEVFSCEVSENVAVLNAASFLVVVLGLSGSLDHALELIADHKIHAFENFNQVSSLGVQVGLGVAAGENDELAKDSFSPSADLVVDDVDSLELLLDGRVVLLDV